MPVAQEVFSALREMDEEAIPRIETDGTWRTGLCWYYGHEQRQNDWPTRDDSERAWCRRLGQVLPKRGGIKSVSVDRRYPTGRGFADLVLGLASGKSCWLEVKGAWTAKNQCVPLERNPSFLKHLTGETSSLSADFSKVAQLAQPDADYIGVVLVGFVVDGMHGYDITDVHIDSVRRAGRIVEEGWQEHTCDWSAYHQSVIPGRTTENFRVRCWFWHRAV